MELKKRDISVDIIKFFAVFLIINSYADICYPKYSFLATGGAIGDCLFLFVSGYSLFLGEMKRFDNYYKRRISRIYPSAFATILVMLIFNGGFCNLLDIIILGGGRPFLNAIMIYYIILWFVRKYFVYKIHYAFIIVIFSVLVAYWFYPYKYETGERGLYGVTTIFRWIPYFGVMLLGAYIGVIRERLKFNIRFDMLKLVVCFIAFYGIQFFAREFKSVAPYQVVTIPFLYGIVYYAYKCCNANMFRRIYENYYANWVILVVGGLSLESYLIQGCVITDKWNNIFPFNLFFIAIAVLILSYVVRCIARLFGQTFRTEDYEWKKVFSLK